MTKIANKNNSEDLLEFLRNLEQLGFIISNPSIQNNNSIEADIQRIESLINENDAKLIETFKLIKLHGEAIQNMEQKTQELMIKLNYLSITKNVKFEQGLDLINLINMYEAAIKNIQQETNQLITSLNNLIKRKEELEIQLISKMF